MGYMENEYTERENVAKTKRKMKNQDSLSLNCVCIIHVKRWCGCLSACQLASNGKQQLLEQDFSCCWGMGQGMQRQQTQQQQQKKERRRYFSNFHILFGILFFVVVGESADKVGSLHLLSPIFVTFVVDRFKLYFTAKKEILYLNL